MIAYAVDDHSKPSQVFCNALLVVAELDGSPHDYMHDRWFNAPGEAWYRRLDPPWHDPLMAAFALCHSEVCAWEREFWAGANAKGQWIEPEGGWNE